MSKKIGRPKSSSKALIAVCARRGRIVQRQQEEAALLARPGVAAFLSSMRSETATFASRCVPGEPLPRMLSGEKFDWDAENLLTDCRDTATKIINDVDYKWGKTQELCQQFLARLEGSEPGVFVDPVACETVDRALVAFAPPDFIAYYLLLLDLVEYFGTKRSDGSYVFSRKEMNCEEWLGKFWDQTSEALELSDLPIR
jgi:hypothetical protein